VEGARRRRYDYRHYSLDIPQHFARGHPQHPISIQLKEFVAIGVAERSVAASMVLAVYFNRELGSGTVKVADIRTDGMLVAEFKAGHFSSEVLP
jgi:hypothetical protein